METPLYKVEALIEPIESYVRTTIELSKLKLLDRATVVATSLIAKIFVFLILSLVVLFTSIGIALWLGEILGQPFYGFFIVAGFDLVAGLISHFFLYGWIRKTVGDRIIKQLLK